MKCTAKSGRTGLPCKRDAIKGGSVCYIHGGAAPQVKRSAAARLAMLVDPAIGVLDRSMSDKADPRVALMAARDVLDRNGFKPPDRHVVTGADGGALELNVSPSEQLLSRIAGLVTGDAKTPGA
jgi:hypothetical protein